MSNKEKAYMTKTVKNLISVDAEIRTGNAGTACTFKTVSDADKAWSEIVAFGYPVFRYTDRYFVACV